jgi:hypothetical protein
MAEGTRQEAQQRRAEGREHRRSIAQWFCLVMGPVLVLVGLLGFLAESRFDTASGGDPGALDGHDFIIFEVNGWHNVVHIAIGALLLVAAGSAARGAALFVGILYIALCVLGFIATGDGGITFVAKDDVLLKVVPVNNEDNVLHLILGITGVIAYFASRPIRRTAAAS